MAHWDPQLPVTSSREPDWAPEARACYQDALRALLNGNLPFVVGGAFAVHKYTGIWRETKDLDFLLPPSDIPAAFERLRAIGFETNVEDPVWLAKARRGDYFVDLITGVGNASLSVDKVWIERSVPEVVLDIPCRVLAVEECIASKMFVAFRERFDGADVAHLILACGRSLDWDRLLHLVGPHRDLLLWSLMLFAYVYPAQTDAVPQFIWDELTHSFLHHVAHPDKTAPFRGSLVDPRMFAIDVDEWGERNLYREYCENHPCPLQETPATGGNR